jgi:hypothetical protein
MKDQVSISLTREEILKLLREPSNVSGLIKTIEKASGARGPVSITDSGATVTLKPKWDEPGFAYINAAKFKVEDLRKFFADGLEALSAWDSFLR